MAMVSFNLEMWSLLWVKSSLSLTLPRALCLCVCVSVSRLGEYLRKRLTNSVVIGTLYVLCISHSSFFRWFYPLFFLLITFIWLTLTKDTMCILLAASSSIHSRSCTIGENLLICWRWHLYWLSSKWLSCDLCQHWYGIICRCVCMSN